MSSKRDSNSQHSLWKSDTLPIELLLHDYNTNIAFIKILSKYIFVNFCKLDIN